MIHATARTVVLFAALLAPACNRAPAASASPASTTAATHVATAGHEAPLRRLSLDEVQAKISRHDNVVVFDNNSRERYTQGHLPGARWVAFNQVTAADLPADHGTELVFYCGGEQCNACHTAAYQAQALGYTNVAIMPAGIRGWVAAGKPVETAAPSAT